METSKASSVFCLLDLVVTQDIPFSGRFVIKRINKPEHKCVTGPFGPKYCDYIRSTPNSSLCKIVGVYTIGFQNWATTKESLHIDVVVMENLMYGRDIRESFDLKGCLRNRYTSPLGELLEPHAHKQ